MDEPLSSKPKYIPETFFVKVCNHISFIKDHLKHLNRCAKSIECNKRNIQIYKGQELYLMNMVSDDLVLKDFYIQNKENTNLLLDILYAFLSLPEWRYDYKTSGREDAILIKKMEKNLRQCVKYLSESPDVRLNIQFFWEDYIRNIITSGCNETITDDGRNVLQMAKKITFPNMPNIGELRQKGMIINDSTISGSLYLDFMYFFVEISDHLKKLEVSAEQKTSRVKKINAGDAYIHYIIRNLKEVMQENEVCSRRHVKYISDLVNGILEEEVDVSEDRIRKLLH